MVEKFWMVKGKPNIYQVNTDVVEGAPGDVRSSQRLKPHQASRPAPPLRLRLMWESGPNQRMKRCRMRPNPVFPTQILKLICGMV